MLGQVDVVVHVCVTDGCSNYTADGWMGGLRGVLCPRCDRPMQAVATTLNVPIPEPVPA